MIFSCSLGQVARNELQRKARWQFYEKQQSRDLGNVQFWTRQAIAISFRGTTATELSSLVGKPNSLAVKNQNHTPSLHHSQLIGYTIQ